MMLLLKSLFFILAIFQINIGEAKVVVLENVISRITFLNTLSSEKSSVELENVFSENDFANTGKSGSDLVDYRNLAISSEATAAKGGQAIITRSVGAAPKGFSTILQSGGHTLNKSTLKALGLTKGQGKIAIEALKNDLRLPANFHGKIMGNGDLAHPHSREVLGNLFNYLH